MIVSLIGMELFLMDFVSCSLLLLFWKKGHTLDISTDGGSFGLACLRQNVNKIVAHTDAETKMDNLVKKLRSSIGLYTTEAVDKQLHNEAADEIERLRTQLILAKAEIDGIHSLLEDVREDYFKERALVDGLTQAILDHLGASLEYCRD
jgi:hypothetical protein